MRDNFLFKTRDLDTHSRSASREREKRDGYSRQHTKNPNNDGSKLHIGHLPQGVSEEFIKGQFERFGRVDDVRIMRKDTNGQQLKGYIYAFVTMCNPEEARYALEGINQDRILAWSVSYSKEKGNRDSPRSPQRNPRNKPRYIEESSEDRVAKKSQQQNFMASENENHESEQNQIQDNLSGGSNDTKEPAKEPSDNPDDFISYNNNDSDEFGDNHSMLNENFIGYGNHNTADIMEEPNAYNNSLMSLLCSNDGDNSQKVKETAKVVQQAPEKAGPATSSAEKNILNGNSILVRELWLGNLSQNISEGELRDIVSQFGDVENIEDYIKPTTRFAFVKFRTINQASRANEAVQHLKGLLNSPNLKIAFSDHQRRKNVIGNSIDFELDEDLTTIVYIGFSTGATIANENLIRDIFSRYRGEVLNIFVNQMPKQHSAKSYALVEMATKDQAKLARQKLFFEDARRETRIRLGDKNCELCILSKPRAREPFPLVNHGPNQGMHRNFNPNMQHQPMMHPHHRMNGPFGPQNMHYNGPRDHLGNPINFQNHPRGHFQNNMDHPQGYMGPEPMDGPHPNINRFGPHPGPMDMMNHGGFPMEHMGNPHFHNQGFNPNFHPGNGFNPNFGPHPFHGFNHNNNNMHMNHGFNPNNGMYNNGGGFEEGKRHFGGMDHSDMQSLVSSTAVSSNSKSPREKEANSENIWSGFIVKSKQNRVGVDALLVQGDDSLLRKDAINLNISHRIMYDEIPDKPIKAMVTFIPTDNSQNELFSGLLRYFLERDRAGFISLEHHTLYLLPPCEKTSEFHQIGQHELLGLIFDTKDSGSRSNKFSRMASEIKYDQDNDSDINEALSILRSNDFEHLLI